MDESACQLDESFVERMAGSAPLFEPEILEDIVGFVKEAVVKALEISKIARVSTLGAGWKRAEERLNFLVFCGHWLVRLG